MKSKYLGKSRVLRLTHHPQPLWPKPSRQDAKSLSPTARKLGTQMSKKPDRFLIKYLAKTRTPLLQRMLNQHRTSLHGKLLPRPLAHLVNPRQLAETWRFPSILHLPLKRQSKIKKLKPLGISTALKNELILSLLPN